MRRPLSLVLPLAASTVVSATPLCAQPPARVMGAPYNNASRAFIDLMIPHQEMATMMSEHAMAAARSDSVKAMARRMMDTQKRALADLKAARRSLFGSDSSRVSMMSMMMQMMDMPQMRDSGAAHPMTDSAQKRPPEAARGERAGQMHMPMTGDMDRMLLQHMIAHHQDGVDMSVLAEHSEAAQEVRRLAKQIREGEERDLVEMRALLATLPGSPAAKPR